MTATATPMREVRPARWLLALVVLALLAPTAVSIPAVLTLLLIVLGARWSTRRVARALSASISAPRWANPDEDIVAVVRVHNRSRVPAAWMEIDVPSALPLGRTAPYREALSPLPASTVTCDVPLRCLSRGRHMIGPPRVRLGDVLGLAEVAAPSAQPAAVTVFPRIVALERLGLPAHSPFATVPSRRSLLVDQSSVIGVRDYEAGDPRSAIHWTATARTGRLSVKQYERAEAREVLVCLDLCPRGYARGTLRPAVELAITTAASVLHHAVVTERSSAGLVAGAWKRHAPRPVVRLAPRDGQAHLRAMLEVLAVAQAGSELTLPHLLATLGHGLATGTTVMAVTGRLDEATVAHLVRLARDGVPVAVAVTGSSTHQDFFPVDGFWLPVYRITDVPSVTRLAA